MPDSVRRDLGDGAFLEYYETFFDRPSAEQFLADFLAEGFPWERQAVRGVLTRRANAWFATDARFVYRYSGQTWIPEPFTPALRKVAAAVAGLCDCELNSVLAALYPDGQAGVSWHDDNDFPTLPDAPIISVTFGEPRWFKVRRKSDREVVAEYELAHGSVVVMGGAMQRYFDHAVLKTTKEVGPRVNLSYRHFRLA